MVTASTTALTTAQPPSIPTNKIKMGILLVTRATLTLMAMVLMTAMIIALLQPMLTKVITITTESVTPATKAKIKTKTAMA